MDYFSLDGLSGDLTSAKPIDRELLSNNNGIITLTVRVSLNLHTIFYLIFVYILIFFKYCLFCLFIFFFFRLEKLSMVQL